jgi:23S rRNA (guanosine2251-2'-O)-methyltransferase
MHSVVLIVHNVRSCHNVGSLLRTAEGLGVGFVYLSGSTPHPFSEGDARLPHLAKKLDAQIHKTALGAEHMIPWKHSEAIEPVLDELKAAGFTIVALEQHKQAVNLFSFQPSQKTALIVGREVEGIEPEVLTLCDTIVEIPMSGQKESFNVAAAAAMALYHIALVSSLH